MNRKYVYIFLFLNFQIQSTLKIEYDQNITLFFTGIAMKWGITYLEFSEVEWLLWPVRRFLSLFTGWPSERIIDGYLFPRQILLSLECSGVHFFTISFLSFWFLLAQSTKTLKAIIYALLFAYVITILANTSRILFFISDSAHFLESTLPQHLSHQVIGGVIFCFWLFASSFFIQQKITQS